MVVTLATGGLLGLLFFWLSWRVVQVRLSAQVLLGDGGDAELLSRIRAHANFAEYVPFCLLLLLAIEASFQDSPKALWAAGMALVAARAAHAIGMAKGGTNAFRAGGALATWGIMIALSVWALVIALRY